MIYHIISCSHISSYVDINIEGTFAWGVQGVQDTTGISNVSFSFLLICYVLFSYIKKGALGCQSCCWQSSCLCCLSYIDGANVFLLKV